MLVTRPDDLTLIPGTNTGGEIRPLKVFSSLFKVPVHGHQSVFKCSLVKSPGPRESRQREVGRGPGSSSQSLEPDAQSESIK